MSIFKDFDWSFKSIAKIIGMVILAIIALVLVIALISFSFRTVFQSTRYDERPYYEKSIGLDYTRESVPQLSSSISLPPIPEPGGTGSDAEEFEVKTYSATIKSNKLKQTCKVISDLKSFDYVIFEDADQNDDNCYFRFKVEKGHTNEILAIIESLKPENLNENIRTIKGSIEFYDKQLEILEKKLASIEETLENARSDYDKLSDLATKEQDVESLATIINNKLNLIERQTNNRQNIESQIDRYNQNKADQLDRLKFSFFNVNVFKDIIFDWKEIKDSWKFEIKAFVRNVNDMLQAVSINLVTYMIRFIQVAIYFFISVLLIKFAWVATRRIWRGKKK